MHSRNAAPDRTAHWCSPSRRRSTEPSRVRSSVSHDLPITLVASRLYGLGGMAALDGRVSWAPQNARGYQPVNCYLLVEAERALLIDTGLPVHLSQVTEQL